MIKTNKIVVNDLLSVMDKYESVIIKEYDSGAIKLEIGDMSKLDAERIRNRTLMEQEIVNVYASDFGDIIICI